MYKSIVSICAILISLTVFGQKTSYDEKIGKEYSEQIANEMGIYEHNTLSKITDDLGQKLVSNIEDKKFNYQFEIVDMAMPNAFALPGGYVYISRGLFVLLNSEDDLAGVIGHEIGHCEYRHSIKQMRRRIIPAILKLPGEIVALTVSENVGKIVNTPLNAGSGLFLAKYSRKHEKQADRFGLNLMAVAGFEPHHFPEVLDRLSKVVEQITGETEQFTYFDSHPYTPKRVGYLESEIKKHKLNNNMADISDNDAFLLTMDGLIFGENPKHGVFNDNKFTQPTIGIHVTFPKGWLYDVQPNAFGAMDTVDEKSMIVIGELPETKAPELAANEYLKKIAKESSKKPEFAKAIDLNGMPAYLVSFKDDSGGEVIGIHNLWFNLNDISYQMVGIAPEKDFELLKATGLSIRATTAKDINTLKVNKIRVLKANANESIEGFCKRVGTSIKPELIATINGLEKDAVLKENQLVKVIIEENYVK